MSSLLSKWSALPRAVRWLAVGAVVAIAYVGVINPLLTAADSFSTKADRYERELTRERDFADPESSDGQYLQAVERVFGRPHMPGSKVIKPESFYRLVDGVLQGHGVTDSRVEESKVRLSGDAAASLGVGTIDRLILNITFEADPETVIAVLSDLERAPDVVAVSRVRIDKISSGRQNDTEKLVRATLAPETWISSELSSATTTSPVNEESTEVSE